MKMKKISSFIAALVVAAMCLTACGATQSETKTSSTKETTPKTEDSAGTLTTITAVKNIGNLELERIMGVTGEDMDNNRWNDLIKERLGYDIKYLWVTNDGEQFTQKFNASIATGDISDIVSLGSADFKRCGESGLLADLTQAYEEYASPLLREIIESAGPEAMESSKINGKLYAIPIVDANIERGTILWIRKDWLEQTGKEIPKSMEEMVELITEFKKLAGDGAVGLPLRKELFAVNANYTTNGVFYAHGAYPQQWVEKNGELVYGTIQPEMKEGLLWLANMYKTGMLDQEFYVKNESTVDESIVSGKCGIFYGAHWSPLGVIQNNLNQDAEAEWIPWNIPSVTGEPAKVGIEMATNAWFASSADSPAPQAVIEMANLYCEVIFDKEKQQYDVYGNPGGEAEGMWKLSPVSMMTPTKNIDIAKTIRPYLEKNVENPEELYGETLQMYNLCYQAQNGDRSQAGWNLIFGVNGACQVQAEQQLEPGNTHMNAYFGPPTETMNSVLSIINEQLNAELTKIIIGEKPIEAFDEAVAAWMAGGGDQITNEINEWYKQK